MGKFFNSVTGQMEDDGKGGMDFSNMFAMPTGIPEQSVPPTPAPSTQKQMDPAVAQYLQQKMQSSRPIAQPPMPNIQPPTPMVEDQFSPDKYKQALAKSQSEQDNTSLAQMASGIGAALAGRDPGSVDNYYSDLRKNIQDRTVGEFNRQKAAQSTDPNSPKSAAFRKLVESTLPNIAKSYGPKWNMVSEEDAKNILNFGQMRETIDARKQQAAMLLDAKKEERLRKDLPSERIKNLSGTDKARFDNARMAAQALDEMDQALAAGDNTFSLIGDTAYTAAARRATEAYGRMQSGGAINKEEEARFEKTLPRPSDSVEIQRQKLIKQKEEMVARLKTLGFTPEQADVKVKDYQYGKSQKPKTVVQNGHTYTLNEQTGEYE